MDHLDRATHQFWELLASEPHQINVGLGPISLGDQKFYSMRAHLVFFDYQISIVRVKIQT